ncbi:MAG: hypothetical protein J6S74_00355 [Alphaproteobacteria bacterium]|nr:hypothetical protein [Alphaproteobacteria bacterium]
MKRLIFVIGGLLALPAFAEVSPYYFDDMTEFVDMEAIDEDDGVVEAGVVIEQENNNAKKPVMAIRPNARAISPRASSRANPDGRATVSRGTNNATVSRGVTSRGTSVSRNTSAASATRGVASRASVSRASNTNTGVVSRRSATSTQKANVARAATSTGTQVFTGGSNAPLYIQSNTGRVSARRAPSVGSVSITNTSTTTPLTASAVQDTVSNMDSIAELTDYCKAQYTACMDNFCNVLDDNQGRCTCSKNVKNYEKIENALASATEALQDVAQKIQYIGLSADEITTLFTQTEAELAMNGANDTTALKNDLDRIRKMIVDVQTGSANAVSETVLGSLDFTNLFSLYFDSYGISISSVFGTTPAGSTQSIGNQRGEALYRTAASRCQQAVLSNCVTQGVESAVIVNAYDMEIDKQCIRYERALTDSNRQMSATVRNAKTVLQKARLMVAQQKNQYDLRGCINALDTCMMDDYVCGNDYSGCLDPTGRYIVDGEVVVGSMPGESGGEWDDDRLFASKGLYTVWNKGGNSEQNIWGPATDNAYNMSNYIGDTLRLENAKTNAPKDISEFLQTKIGYRDNDGRNHGMCMSVLNKCQLYTYDKDGNYLANNQVIAEYMQRAFRQIKSAQDTILSNYASNCLADVTSCLSQNNYAFGATTSGSLNYSDIAIRACLPVINTCRSVTLGLSEADVQPGNFADIYVWLDAGIGTGYQKVCENTGGVWQPNSASPYTGICSCSVSDGAVSGLKQSGDKKTCVCSDANKRWDENTNQCVSGS